MTRSAAALRPGGARHVLRVIEVDVETLFEFVGKSFARRVVAVHAFMTD
jgi:hypothetical protein